MRIIDKSAHMTKFSNLAEGTVFKINNEYFIKIKSMYDDESDLYRNAISLSDYKAYSIDQAYEVRPYYNVSLLLKN